MRIKVAGFSLMAFVLIALTSCGQKTNAETKTPTKNNTVNTMDANAKLDTITIGGGCFWCTEAIFQRLNGVISVESGYSGGKIKNPTYKEVCSGMTGHAECTQITYDASKVSLAEILASKV